MNGYYPSIYGFENDEEGYHPSGWTVNESGGPIQVLNDYGNHKNLVEIEDNSGSGTSFIQLNTTAQEYGTVEVWLRNTDANEYCQLRLGRDNGLTDAIRVSTRAYYWRISTFTTWINIIPAVDNHWYHVRIDFECGNSGYQGLLSDQCYVYIDEIKFGPYAFQNNVADIDSIMISTSYYSSGRKIYLDALSYSWDPDYVIGDNLKEGLLLSYINTTNLDWKGYSLDGQSNITISGNTAIPMPNIGTHSIQVFGNDSIGTYYESDLRYFIIDTPPPPDIPDLPFGLSFLIYIIIFAGFGLIIVIYLFVIRPKTVKSRELKKEEMKKQVILERQRREQAIILERQRKEQAIILERKRREQAIIDKISKAMSVSTRIKIDLLRNYLKINENLFNEKILDWADQFGFTIDGDYLNVGKGNVSDFIDELENQFERWRRIEDNKLDKI